MKQVKMSSGCERNNMRIKQHYEQIIRSMDSVQRMGSKYSKSNVSSLSFKVYISGILQSTVQWETVLGKIFGWLIGLSVSCVLIHKFGNNEKEKEKKKKKKSICKYIPATTIDLGLA